MNVASICVPIASQVPHAAGLAWGLRLKGSDAVASVLFGDGATSEGAFHEGANLAAVTKAPLVLVCNNNQWAISTPLEAQTAAERLSDKAAGYGMPALRVDGHDVLAVYEAAREAAARARAGGGPTFVEAVTYRAAPHATADDPSLYVDPERVEAARERDCVAVYEEYLTRARPARRGARRLGARRGAGDHARGHRAAEDEPPGDPELVFSHAYADPPPALARDFEDLMRVHGR